MTIGSGSPMLDAELARTRGEPIDARAVEVSGPADAVRLGHAREQLEVHFLRQSPEGPVTDRRYGLEEG